MNRVRYGYAAAAWIVDYYEYNVRICLALLYPTQALVFMSRRWPQEVECAFVGMRGTHLEAHARSWVHQHAAKSIKLMRPNLFLITWWNSGGKRSSNRPEALGRPPFVTGWTRRGPNLAHSVVTIVQRLKTKKIWRKWPSSHESSDASRVADPPPDVVMAVGRTDFVDPASSPSPSPAAVIISTTLVSLAWPRYRRSSCSRCHSFS